MGHATLVFWLMCAATGSVAVQDELPWLTVRAVDRSANPSSKRDFLIADEFVRPSERYLLCRQNLFKLTFVLPPTLPTPGPRGHAARGVLRVRRAQPPTLAAADVTCCLQQRLVPDQLPRVGKNLPAVLPLKPPRLRSPKTAIKSRLLSPTSPLRTPSYQEPPICGIDAGKGKWNANTSVDGSNDFAQARALGLSILRLCLSWSEM